MQACMRCHSECETCIGYGLSFCTSCKHFTQDGRCVSECAADHFLNATTSTCVRCDPRCLHCTGPTAGDCLVCKQYKVYADYDNLDTNQEVGVTGNVF